MLACSASTQPFLQQQRTIPGQERAFPEVATTCRRPYVRKRLRGCGWIAVRCCTPAFHVGRRTWQTLRWSLSIFVGQLIEPLAAT